jgi:ubiquinone biosynthesis accessory factor UbiK
MLNLLNCSKAGKILQNGSGANMLNSQALNDLSIKIKEILKNSPLGDAEKNIHALIQGAFTKMELVSREEFDVQTEVLRNTREKLILCEAKLAELEVLLKQQVEKS